MSLDFGGMPPTPPGALAPAPLNSQKVVYKTYGGGSAQSNAHPPLQPAYRGKGNRFSDMSNHGSPTQSGSQSPREAPRPSPREAPRQPPHRTMLDAYQQDIMSGFAGGKPFYNPMNPSRPQTSSQVNVNDPIQIHLLVETALGDSREFEILSQEEVDELKKQVQVFAQRIDQTRQNLAIQSKYRDAAMSMARLYSPTDRKRSVDTGRQRESIFGHSRSGSAVSEADQERIASERRCVELAEDLWTLEKRIMEPQSRLLKHTAGILQMTHKGPKKMSKGQDGAPQNGMPGSPESLYTYSNARASMDALPDELFFDDRSLYRSTDGAGDFLSANALGAPSGVPNTEHMEMIEKTEQRLQDLNNKLRQVIVKANPERNASYGAPPLSGNTHDPGETIEDHLEYLERSIVTIDHEHSQSSRRLQEIEGQFSEEKQESEAQIEETLEDLNSQLHKLLVSYDNERPEPPQLSVSSMSEQLAYFQDSIGAVETQLSLAAGSTAKSSSARDTLQQMEAIILGLWEIIKSGEEEDRKRRQERRETRAAQGHPPDDDDSPDEAGDFNETFSVQAFSSKVQRLYSHGARLKDQKKVLQRQIKQQRELNSKSDASKDAELVAKVDELERTKNLLIRTENEADSLREQLTNLMEKLEEARQQSSLHNEARSNDESSAVRQAQQELDARNQTIAQLEEELQDMKDDRSIANAEMQAKTGDAEMKISRLASELNAALQAATIVQGEHEAKIIQKEKEIDDKEREMEDMNMRIANLQTDVTIARAELDGAYGSKAQRAAEVAANPAIQKEIDGLTTKNAALAEQLAILQRRPVAEPTVDAKTSELKKELEETIEEYEQMTKASIEWEKEREFLEATIDKLRDEREKMEAELSDEKVRWLGMNSPGIDGPAPISHATSTTVLKNEFKKMMRDTRAESAKALRAEQDLRRRIEDELRTLKKAQGPGKSRLSRTTGS